MPPSASQVGMESAYNDRPLTTNEKKGLQFPREHLVRKKKQKLEPLRHPPIEPADTSAKKNANTANQQGYYKEVICIPCAISLSEMTLENEKKWGPITTTCLIALSCVVDTQVGSAGTTCGRCLSLGKDASKCRDPPVELIVEYKQLVAYAKDSNDLLLANEGKTWGNWSAADKATFQLSIDQSKKIANMWKGLMKVHKTLSTSTPTRQRFNTMDLMKGKDLADIAQQCADIRSDIKGTQTAVSLVSSRQQKLRGEVGILKRRSEAARERDRFMVTALQSIARRLDTDPANPLVLPNLDLVTNDFHSDYESSDEEDSGGAGA